MTPVSNGKLIIAASKDRKDLKACLFDIETGKYTGITKDMCTDEQIRELEDVYGTLFIEDKKRKVYGVIRDTCKSKPSLVFIDKGYFEKKKDSILNSNEKQLVKDISDIGIDNVIDKYKKDKTFSHIAFHVDGYKIIRQKEFLQIVENGGTKLVVEGRSGNITEQKINRQIKNESNSVVQESEKKNESSLVVKESEKKNESNSVVQEDTVNKEESLKQATIDRYLKALDKIDDIASKLEKAEEQKQEEINKLKTTLSKINVAYDNEINDTLAEVIDMSNLETEKESIDNNTALDFVYELMLKMLSENDSVSIPRSYYDKLNVSIRKNITYNRDLTIYNSLVYLRFDRQSEKYMFARVEYDINLDVVRINILKPYNNVEIQENQIIDYEIKYNQWRKYNSFTYN